MSSRVLTALTCASLFVSIAVLSAQDGMNKPLTKFTIGDLFPKVSLPLKETSVAWKAAADSARALAVGRTKDIQVALGPMKDQVDKAKDEAKAAEKSKDFAAAGVADGKVKTGSIVVGLLERLKDIGNRQEDMATAWSQAADQMRRFTDIDESFDKYRSAGIARPESGQQDTRMNAEGYEAFKGHASALKDLGAALSQLGDKLNALGSERLKFASELEKGGHIKSK